MTLKLPKAIMDFLKDMKPIAGMTVEEYLTYSIVQVVAADIDTFDVFVPTWKQIVDKYGLTPTLKLFDAVHT